MKKICLFFVLATLVFSTGLSLRPEYAVPHVPSEGPQKHFVYLAYPSDNPIDLGNPANYELTANDGQEIPLCSGFAHRCAVVAEDDGTGHPDFSKPYTIRFRN